MATDERTSAGGEDGFVLAVDGSGDVVAAGVVSNAATDDDRHTVPGPVNPVHG